MRAKSLLLFACLLLASPLWAQGIKSSVPGGVPATGGTMTGPLILPAGSATTAALQFPGSANTGLYSTGAGTFRGLVAGNAAFTLQNTGLFFNNPFGQSSTVAPVASAATIAPGTNIIHVSGTTAITTITPPTICTVAGTGGCVIYLIPDGLWTTGITGNIALASTAVVSRTLIMAYDATTAKWFPSY